jgi:hypothetical protein
MTSRRTAEHVSSGLPDNARAVDAKLDAALADTFPASDPVAITVCRSQPERVDKNPAPTADDPP